MSAHEVSAQIASHMIKVLAAIAMVFVICYAPVKDAADDDKARAHVEQQAKAQMGGRE
jgi:sensor domain CHASE-containing protein